MNEAILLKLMEYLQRTEDFMESEIPLFAQEFISWGFWGGMITCAFLLLLIVLSFAVASQAAELSSESDHDNFGYVATVFISSILGLVFLMGFCSELCDVIKTQVAPRVYLMQEFTKMIKNK